MPHTPPLSDEAVSREGFYDARGWMSVLLRRVWAKAKRLRATVDIRFPPRNNLASKNDLVYKTVRRMLQNTFSKV